jgi:hypothetical protein
MARLRSGAIPSLHLDLLWLVHDSLLYFTLQAAHRYRPAAAQHRAHHRYAYLLGTEDAGTAIAPLAISGTVPAVS